jgi:hypothetical protein
MSRNGKLSVPQDTTQNVARRDLASMDTAVQFVLTNVPRSQLLEMYYWTQEHDILRIVRGLVTLPMQTRQELLFFLDRLQQPDTEPAVEDDDEIAPNAGKTYLLPH